MSLSRLVLCPREETEWKLTLEQHPTNPAIYQLMYNSWDGGLLLVEDDGVDPLAS